MLELTWPLPLSRNMRPKADRLIVTFRPQTKLMAWLQRRLMAATRLIFPRGSLSISILILLLVRLDTKMAWLEKGALKKVGYEMKWLSERRDVGDEGEGG